MLTCPNPTCGKKLTQPERECPRCRADLSLLVDYVDSLHDGLMRADALTRAGQLGEAVWAYLGVLEVDPDNAIARRQVGQVVTAVRQFDQEMPGRRWLHKVRRQARFRQWAHSWSPEADATSWPRIAIWFILLFGALTFGYMLGITASATPLAPLPAEENGAAKEAPAGGAKK